MNAKSDAHEHMLWTLDDLAIHLEKVRALEGLEAEEVVIEVAVVAGRARGGEAATLRRARRVRGMRV